MNKFKMTSRIFVLSVFAALLLTNSASAHIKVEPDSAIDKALDEISFYGLQLDAVSTDMSLYTGWNTEDKETMKKASVIAKEHLDQLAENLNSMNVPEEVEPLRKALLYAVSRHKRIYDGIEQKNIRRVSKELHGLWAKQTRDLAKVAKQYDFTQMQNALADAHGDIDLKSNKNDIGASYKKAVSLIGERKYEEARTVLLELKSQVSNADPEYDYIILSLSDVLGRLDYDETQKASEDSSEPIIRYSEEILSKSYSPLFFEAFVRWRTKTQETEHGLSNWSEIPNWDYNIKRKQLLDKIKVHLANKPQDAEARLQFKRLIDLSNVQRGGPMGNDTLNYLGSLYMTLEPK